MKTNKIIIAVVSAVCILSAATATCVSAEDRYIWTRESESTADTTYESVSETTVTSVSETSDTTSVTSSTTSVKTTTTVDSEKEHLKQQVTDLSAMLEDYGYTIDDLTITVDELRAELEEANNRALNSSSGGGNSGGSSGNSSNNSSGASSNGATSETKKSSEVTTVTTAATTTSVTTVTTAESSVPDTQGNASLVEEAKKEDTERQFITVTAKDGSVFYIVIDYEGDNQNVYFLNKVDIADLEAIANPDGTTVQTAAPVVETETVTSEVTDTVEQQPVKAEKKSSVLPIALIIMAAVIVGYYFIKIRPKKNAVADDYEESEDDYEREDEEIEEEEDEDNTINEEKENKESEEE